MKKDFKRQMKQDELRSGFDHAVVWLRGHNREARLFVVVLAVVGAGVAGLTYFQSHQGALAQQALDEAITTFEAPLESELPPGAPRPAGPVFATHVEKLTKAAAAFDGVERRFGARPAAVRAKYYAAVCRIELGKIEEAEKALTELASRRDPGALEPALARFALADLHRRAGRPEKAVEVYRQLVDDAALPLPRDHALMSLAETLEQAKRLPEARDSYRRLVDQFPSSLYVDEARRRAAFLETGAQG